MSTPFTITAPDAERRFPRTLLLVVLSVLVGSLMMGGLIVYEVRKGFDAYVAQQEEDARARFLTDYEVTRARAERDDEFLRAMHEIAVPPNNDKLFTVLSKGVGFTEYEHYNIRAFSTTPVPAFTVDLTAAQKTDAYTQEFTISNVSEAATRNVCWFPVAWSGVSTCSTLCGASSNTCPASGAALGAAAGTKLTPGSGTTRRFDGTSCMCVVADGAGADAQSERDVR